MRTRGAGRDGALVERDTDSARRAEALGRGGGGALRPTVLGLTLVLGLIMIVGGGTALDPGNVAERVHEMTMLVGGVFTGVADVISSSSSSPSSESDCALSSVNSSSADSYSDDSSSDSL